MSCTSVQLIARTCKPGGSARCWVTGFSERLALLGLMFDFPGGGHGIHCRYREHVFCQFVRLPKRTKSLLPGFTVLSDEVLFLTIRCLKIDFHDISLIAIV